MEGYYVVFPAQTLVGFYLYRPFLNFFYYRGIE